MQACSHEVVVACGSLRVAPSEVVDEEQHDGLRVLRLHRDDLYFESWWKSFSPDVSERFARLLADQRPDVVHVHHWIRLTSDLVRTARAAGCTTAVTLHDYYTSFASPVRRIGDDRPTPPESPSYLGRAEAVEAFHGPHPSPAEQRAAR